MNIWRSGIFAAFCATLLAAPAVAFDDSGTTRNETRFDNYITCAVLAYGSDTIDDSVGDHFMELAYDIADLLGLTDEEVHDDVAAKAEVMDYYRKTQGDAAADDYDNKTARQCNAIEPNGSGADIVFTY